MLDRLAASGDPAAAAAAEELVRVPHGLLRCRPGPHPPPAVLRARRTARPDCSTTNSSRACSSCTTCTPRTATPASPAPSTASANTPWRSWASTSESGTLRLRRPGGAAAAAAAPARTPGRPPRRRSPASRPRSRAVDVQTAPRRAHAPPDRHGTDGGPMTASPADAPPGLRRFLTERPPRPERCELCAVAVPEDGHRHLVDTEKRALVCACVPCALLMEQPGAAAGRFRTVPARYLTDPGHRLDDSAWEASADPGRRRLLLPQRRARPAGRPLPEPGRSHRERTRTGHLGRPSSAAAAWPNSSNPTWRRCCCAAPSGRCECYLVPIDICYELVGRMRLLWQGFDGGAEARADAGRVLRARSGATRPARGAGGRGGRGRDGVLLRLHRRPRRPVRRRTDPRLPAARHRRRQRPRARPRAALPDPHRTRPPRLRARRGRRAGGPLRRALTLGQHPPAGAVRPGLAHGPELHRGDRDRPRRALHLRHGRSPPPATSTPSPTARSRC